MSRYQIWRAHERCSYNEPLSENGIILWYSHVILSFSNFQNDFLWIITNILWCTSSSHVYILMCKNLNSFTIVNTIHSVQVRGDSARVAWLVQVYSTNSTGV